MAGFSIGMEGGFGYAYEGVMDLDNSANMSMDPLFCSQLALSSAAGNGDHETTIDLDNGENLSLVSFHFAYRGNIGGLGRVSASREFTPETTLS